MRLIKRGPWKRAYRWIVGYPFIYQGRKCPILREAGGRLTAPDHWGRSVRSGRRVMADGVGGMKRRGIAALLVAGTLALPGLASTRLAGQDIDMMSRMAQGMQGEMQLARLAHLHATHYRVRQLARWLLVDNTREYHRLQALAQTKGVRLQAEPSETQRALAGRLAQVPGAAFDRQYLSHELEAHRREEEMVGQLLGTTRDEAVRQYTIHHLRSIRAHRHEIEHVLRMPLRSPAEGNPIRFDRADRFNKRQEAR